MSLNGKLVRKWRYDMSKVSCYGCKYDGEKWDDVCKECVRMTIIRPFKDKYTFRNISHTFPELALEASLQEFDTQEPRLVAYWEMPKVPMWHNPTCSNCGRESADHGAYCSRCGAKMVDFLY